MKKARNILWIVFFASLALFATILLVRGVLENGVPGPATPSADQPPLLVWIPLITALVSLTGALTTTILTMRHDRLETRKTELEVTKLQLEIDQLKKNAKEMNKTGADTDASA